MSNNKQNSEEQNHGYICPVTKVQCDDECCVSAEDCHIKSGYGILSSNNKQSSVEWLVHRIKNQHFFTFISLNELEKQAKAMHKEEIETAYNESFRLRDKPYSTSTKYYNETYVDKNN